MTDLPELNIIEKFDIDKTFLKNDFYSKDNQELRKNSSKTLIKKKEI